MPGTPRTSSRVLIRLHEDASYHRFTLMASRKCGCFCCCAEFEPSKIREWIDHGQTALCPKCGIDAVLGYFPKPISRKVLSDMRDYWFSA